MQQLIAHFATSAIPTPGRKQDENGDEDAANDAREEISNFFDQLQPRLEKGWAWIQDHGTEFSMAVGALIAVFLALRILRSVIAGLIRRKKKGEYAPENVTARLISETWSLFLLVVAAALVAPFFPVVPAGWGGYAKTAAIIIGVLQAAIWARELLISALVGYAERERAPSGVLSNAVNLIKALVNFGIWIIAALMILSNLDIEITALIAGLGVGGIAIGLAAQSLFKDLFSSLAIVFDRPFARGDFIMFDNGEYLGDVEKIGMKTTRIRSLSGEQVIVANSQLLDKEIRNFERLSERRALVHIGVLYSTPHEKLCKIPGLVKNAVESVEDARFDRSHLKEYGDSSIVFENVFWSKSKEYDAYMDAKEAVLLNIHKAFEEEGITFAFPTRTIHVETMPVEEE